MEKELAFLLEKFINNDGNKEVFIKDIVDIYLNYNDIGNYLNSTITSFLDKNTSAYYDFKDKNIYVNAKSYIPYCKKINNNNSYQIALYFLIMETVLHELTHARQNFIINTSCIENLESKMLRSSIFVLNSAYINHPKRKELYEFYGVFHDYFPFERDAVMSSYLIMKDVASLINDNYVNYLVRFFERKLVSCYKHNECPIEVLIKGTFKNKDREVMFDYKSLPFYDEKKWLRNLKTLLISEKERFRWGLYLTKKERNSL